VKAKADKAIIDADFALKLGQLEKYRILEVYLPECVELLYIHEHVYNNEILMPPTVKEQIDSLIQNGRAQIVNRNFIATKKPEAVSIYDEIQDLLQQNIIDTVAGHKNWGEIVSIAFSKALGINYFLSDESRLQEIIDEHINLDMEGTDNIRVIRVADFFQWMRDAGVERKVIKLAWLFYENLKDHTTKKDIEKLKRWFDNEFWPVE
jgi:hypothetical protein